MIRVTDRIHLDDRDIKERFVRASGPGGQNVNKLSTAVELRFDLRHCRSLDDDVRRRLEMLAGRRLTREGMLVIFADRHRTQERNRADALARLVDLVRRAAVVPKARRPTRPTAASRRKREEAKRRRSGLKRQRRSRPEPE